MKIISDTITYIPQSILLDKLLSGFFRVTIKQGMAISSHVSIAPIVVAIIADAELLNILIIVKIPQIAIEMVYIKDDFFSSFIIWLPPFNNYI